MIEDRDGHVLTSEESGLRRWKVYFEEMKREEKKEDRSRTVNES